MILYEIFPNKTLKIREDENTYITENLISSVHIKLPSTFGDYPVKELTAELRFYFPEGDYMAYAVDTQQACPEVPITNDITEEPQTLSVMLFFYKDGNVIGKTNSVEKEILDSHLKGEPLTPRAEFDEVIAEQRETIAEQTETITEQEGTISSQGERITELSGEVTELTSENTRLKALTDTQNETIQYMIDNPFVPQLETLDPVNPTTEQVTYRPSGDNVGFTGFTVNGVTSAIDSNIQPENIANGKTILGVKGIAARDINDFLSGNTTIFNIEVDDLPLYSLSYYPQSLEAINLPNVEILPSDNNHRYIIFNLPNLTTIIMNGLKYLYGYNKIGNNSKLKNIEMNNLLEINATLPFDYCVSLEKITFPKLKRWEGDTACRGCQILNRMILPSITCLRGDEYGSNTPSFKYLIVGTPNCSLLVTIPTQTIVNNGANIYVPDEYVTSYQSATNWSLFANNIKPISELPPDIYQEYLEAKEIAESD